MPGLYAIKPWFVTRLRRAEDVLAARRVSPDTVTLTGVVVASLAAAAVVAGRIDDRIWLLVPPFALLRLACNALDGSLARRTGVSRPAGAVLNEAADRYGDAVMIGATGIIAGAGLAAAAVAAAFLCSWSGVLSQALTGSRSTGGPMGKADRIAVLAVAAGVAPWAGPRVFHVALVVIIAGALVTVAVRTRVLVTTLGETR
ncbi:MAG TPA: phosphatidate cytidylyltransferase [Actinomycetota bacterium]|jgi:CDP-diacylglycerol---glycerol-3-phosphate 3-phosphatidyltransferase|nr:phosphatidate cytidylyltransferase [Actinomycetota bacterium]